MEKIKEVREALGIKQCHLAKEIGLNKSSYNVIEKGKRKGTESVKIHEEKAKDFLSERILLKVKELEQEMKEVKNLSVKLYEK